MEKMNSKNIEIINHEDARLLLFKIENNIDELFQMLEFINVIEYNKLVSDKRKREYLAVRIALKNLLGEEKNIVYNADGKPELSDKSFQISISHSVNWIAVMTHPHRLVGIDIEVPTDKIKKVYKRFLSEIEQIELSNAENINQLLLAWSAKETLFKIIGNEAVDFANQLHIFPFELHSVGTFMAEHCVTMKQFQLHYTQNEEYTLVYCLV